MNVCIFTGKSDSNSGQNLLFCINSRSLYGFKDSTSVWIYFLMERPFKCYKNVSIINRLCVFDYCRYLIMIYYPIISSLMHGICYDVGALGCEFAHYFQNVYVNLIFQMTAN